ncbi:MAG: sulfatase/phosphatase domain-containing protein, partial [Verrucomicrobiota bacterium]
AIYYHYYEYPSVHMVPRQYGVRTDRYKLMSFYQFEEWEFYDLENDPDERTNLYNNPEYAAQIEQMKQRLIALQTEYGDDSAEGILSPEDRHKFREGRQASRTQ